LNKFLFLIFGVLGVVIGYGQDQPSVENDTTDSKQIKFVYGANFTVDEEKFPGAFIFSKDTRQVQFEHQGADLWCDIAIHYKKENRLRAIGNVRLEQGDSIKLTGGKIDYDGETKLAKIYEQVLLRNESEENSMTLQTDTLDSANTLTSEVGRYFMELKKYQFLDSVHIQNPEYTLDSEQLDYYTTSKNAYMYGPSTITGDTYVIYCERGFYDTKIENGYFIKNTRIDYNNRIIEGDSLYFDQGTEFASATNNVVVTDTVNKGVIRSHYAEVFKAKDSVFATKRARVLRAFRNAKFYKTDLSGKCDSIYSSQKTGITQLIKEPVIWNLDNQMTGDSIHLISNLETEKLDSLKVLDNAFVISQDTIGKVGFNQAKGKDLFGKFKDNELRIIDLVKNTEVIYYMYDDDDDLMGINKTICSKIRITMKNSDIEDLVFITDPNGDIYPETELPETARKLKGFVWRGEERLLSKDDIFDADDNDIELVVIKGVTNPIDIDAGEEQRSLNAGDPVNNLPLPEQEKNEQDPPPKKEKTN